MQRTPSGKCHQQHAEAQAAVLAGSCQLVRRLRCGDPNRQPLKSVLTQDGSWLMTVSTLPRTGRRVTVGDAATAADTPGPLPALGTAATLNSIRVWPQSGLSNVTIPPAAGSRGGRRHAGQRHAGAAAGDGDCCGARRRMGRRRSCDGGSARRRRCRRAGGGAAAG